MLLFNALKSEMGCELYVLSLNSSMVGHDGE